MAGMLPLILMLHLPDWERRSPEHGAKACAQRRSPARGDARDDLTALVERHGFPAMGLCLDIRCFTHDPSIKSSLTFLRKNPWARALVERMYLTGDLRPGKVRAAIARQAGKPRKAK